MGVTARNRGRARAGRSRTGLFLSRDSRRGRGAIAVGPRGGGARRAPAFAGLKAATTCLPGPIGPPRPSSYHLRWSTANDDRTPQNEIVYDVYQATSAGGQDVTKPTYTTAPGATTFWTPELTSAESWHFVVRARDRSGNRDQNKVERIGENLCL